MYEENAVMLLTKYMVTLKNKERLEQEISNLINLIARGRAFFFAQTETSLESSEDWFDHFATKDLFQKHLELIQLELNIQLLYIKLPAYYDLLDEKGALKKPRNAFAHELTDLIFSKRVKYNFFLHNVTCNFKKIEYLFYTEGSGESEGSVDATPLILNLDEDIGFFLEKWKSSTK